MRLFLSLLLIALLSAIAAYIMPWWVIAIVSFMVSIIAGLRPGKAFVAGFFGVGLCWLVVALMRDLPNNHILSQRMATLFFKTPNYGLFIAVAVFLGGLVGGLAALSGSLFVKRPMRRK